MWIVTTAGLTNADLVREGDFAPTYPTKAAAMKVISDKYPYSDLRSRRMWAGTYEVNGASDGRNYYVSNN